MPVREWSAKKLGRVWIAGVTLQVVIVAGAFLISRYDSRVSEPTLLERMEAYQDSVHRGLLPAPPPITPDQRARALAELEAKTGIRIESRGDSAIVIATPEAQEKMPHVAEAVMSVALMGMLIVGTLYLPIPITLVLITATWMFGRWRRRNGIANAAT